MKFIPVLIVVIALIACSTIPEPQRDSVTASAGEKQLLEQTRKLISESKYTEARNKAAQALTLNPDNAEAQFAVAVCYFYLHEYEKSITVSSQAARYRSDFLPDIYLLMGASYERLDDLWNALRTYRDASQRYPDIPQLQYQLALVYIDLDKPELAAETLKNVLYLDPLNPNPHFQLGMLYADYGYRTPALLALSIALALEPVGGKANLINDTIDALLSGNDVHNPASGTLNRADDTAPQSDEGDFASTDAALSSARRSLLSRGIPAESSAMLKAQYQAFFNAIEASHGAPQSRLFVPDFYLPMYHVLYQKGLDEALINRIFQGRQDQVFRQWVEKHHAEEEKLLETIRHHSWPVRAVSSP